MIMSENLRVPIGAQNLPGQFWGRRLIAALGWLWAAYLNWRIEQQTIAHLRSMSDVQLKDIGLVRSQIEFSARVGMHAEQPRTIMPF